MTNLISSAIARISSLLKGFQVKQFLTVVLVGFLLLTTNVGPEGNNPGLTKKINDIAHQNDSDRPKTIGEWSREAQQTDGNLGERAKRIAKESGEAIKDWGSVYPDTAARSADDLGAESGSTPFRK